MAYDKQARQRALDETLDEFDGLTGMDILLYEEGENALRRIIVSHFKPLFDEMDEEIAELKRDREEMWGALEDVCVGTRLYCEKCQKYQPCSCDKGSTK